MNTAPGNRAQLHCSYNTSSTEKVLWRKDGQLISADDKKYEIENEPRIDGHHAKSTLVIRDVKVPIDLGKYECIVQNQVGKGHSTILVVLVPEPPRYHRSQIDGEVVTSHWTVRSAQPLSEVLLNYQKDGVNTMCIIIIILVNRF